MIFTIIRSELNYNFAIIITKNISFERLNTHNIIYLDPLTNS